MSEFGEALDEMDVEAFMNMRAWLKNAVEAAGATVIDAGIGMGQADIGIRLEGYTYGISIRPRSTRDATKERNDERFDSER